MASYNELIALIDAFIKRNGVQAITGQILNGVLKAMVDQVGRGYAIMGVATPSTNPGTPDAPESWFASTPGTYTNFGGLEVADAEFALLSYTPTGEVWTKTTLTEGIQEVSASIDGNVGTPEVTAEYINGGLVFTFSNMKGQTGDAAGFGTVNATVDGNIGTPGVSVQTSGPDTAKNMTFQFTNLKGETGVTSVVVTVDNTTGNPACAVSLSGQVLHLDFTGLKGAQGDTGVSADFPITIANNLTTNDPTAALSAAQGVVLAGELSQLEAKVTGFGASQTLRLDGTHEMQFPSPNQQTEYEFPVLHKAGVYRVTISAASSITDGMYYSVRDKDAVVVVSSAQMTGTEKTFYFNANKDGVYRLRLLSTSVRTTLTVTIEDLTGEYFSFYKNTDNELSEIKKTLPLRLVFRQAGINAKGAFKNSTSEWISGFCIYNPNASYEGGNAPVIHCYDNVLSYLGQVASFSSIPEGTYWLIFQQATNVSGAYYKYPSTTEYATKAYVDDAIEQAISESGGFVDATKFGVSSSADAGTNTTALQGILTGGNKTIVIAIPGTYKFNATLLIDDNTTLIFGEGVIIQKDSSYQAVFRNSGTNTRTRNKNIRISGAWIDVNGYDAVPTYASAIYGLRGQMSFLCVDNLVIENIRIYGLGTNQYGIQVNSFTRLAIRNIYIDGRKDGIHLSSGDGFLIENVEIHTQDDALCFNSSDWDSSNCVDGSVKNGVVRNAKLYGFTYNGTFGVGSLRFLVGAIVDWYSGMSIKRGDRVVNGGRVYRAIQIPTDGTILTSQTAPTITTYNSYQQDAGGFLWKLMTEDVFYQTNVENIRFENCQFYQGNRLLEEVDTTSNWNRSLYPDVAKENYPHISRVVFCGCKWFSQTEAIATTENANTEISFRNTEVVAPVSFVEPSSGLSKKYTFNNSKFAGEITQKAGNHFVVRGGESPTFAECAGRVESDVPIVGGLPADAVVGDIVRTSTHLYVRAENDWSLIV